MKYYPTIIYEVCLLQKKNSDGQKLLHSENVYHDQIAQTAQPDYDLRCLT